MIGFNPSNNFIHDEKFTLPLDFDFGDNLASSYGLKSVIGKSGIYPVSYSYNLGGETIIDIELNE